MNDADPQQAFSYGPHEVQRVLDHIRIHAGPVVAAIEARDAKGRAAAGTPQKNRHRLAKLVHDAERTMSAMERGETVDARPIVELVVIADMMERWHTHPEWPAILHALESADHFSHDVIKLIAAWALPSHGTQIDLLPVDPGWGRLGDVIVVVSDTARMVIEAKAPRRLREGGLNLTASEADLIVRSSWKKAGTGQAGQLPPGVPGMLVVGGFHLTREVLDLLNEAAQREWRRHSSQRTHIAAVVIFSIGIRVDSAAVSVSGQPSAPAFQATTEWRHVPNPWYQGNVEVAIREGPHRFRMTDAVRSIFAT